MKKFLFLIPLVALAFGVRPAQATTTQLSIPPIGDLVGGALDTAGAFLTGLWPILGPLIGLAILGWIISKLH